MHDPAKLRGPALGATPLRGPRFLLVLVALSVFLTALGYARTLGYWFTGLDSLALVRASEVRTATELVDVWTEPLTGGRAGHYANFYRPGLQGMFAVLFAIFGWQPFGYHGAAILLHALNGGLTGWLAARVASRAGTGKPELAGLAAALVFLIHPLGEEIVPATARLGDLLVTALSLAALVALDRRPGLAALALFAAALAAKESGVVLLAVVPLYLLLVRTETPRRTSTKFVAASAGLAFAFLVVRALVLEDAVGGYMPFRLSRSFGLAGHILTTLPVDLLVPGYVVAIPEQLPSIVRQLLGWWLAPVAALVLVLWALSLRSKSPGAARAVLFAIGSIAAHALLFVVAATYERRYGYALVPFLAVLIAVMATRFGWIRFAAAATTLVLLSQSPLVRSYDEWRSAGEAARAITEGARDAWAGVPPGARVYLLNLPESVSLDPMRRDPLTLVGQSSTRVVSHYSIGAWLDGRFPEKRLALVQLGSLVYLEPPELFRNEAVVREGRLEYRLPKFLIELEPLSPWTARAYREDARNGDEAGFVVDELAGPRRALSFRGEPRSPHAFVVVYGAEPFFTPLSAIVDPDP